MIGLALFITFIGIFLGDLLVMHLVMPSLDDLEIRMVRLEKRVDFGATDE